MLRFHDDAAAAASRGTATTESSFASGAKQFRGYRLLGRLPTRKHARKSKAPETTGFRGLLPPSLGGASDRVVHLELDRVRRVLEGVDLFVFEIDVGLDEVLGEDLALQEEGMVGA